MARTKLIAKYAALDTPDLGERIHKTITDYIEKNGIERLPYLEVNGRWTGTLSISDGGWRGDYDFLYPVLSMCKVDPSGKRIGRYDQDNEESGNLERYAPYSSRR